MKLTTTTSRTKSRPPKSPDAFDDFAALVNTRAKSFAGRPLFRVRTSAPLFSTWLASFKMKSQRQVHDCRCCRRFLERYGNLAAVAEDGSLEPIFWGEGFETTYWPAAVALHRQVRRGRIESVFYDDSPEWGTHESGGWSHFGVPSLSVSGTALKTPAQLSAEKAEDFGTLERALAEYDQRTIEQAVQLLKGEQLYRSEKVLGVAEWFLNLKMVPTGCYSGRYENLRWLAVAPAPPGFCHVRSSMIGTLLDDLQSGMSLAEVQRRFSEKMNPLQYQRPTAPPKAGNVLQAEHLVEQLRSAGALERRFAWFDEVEKVWQPSWPGLRFSRPGVFGHLLSERTWGRDTVAGSLPITFEKFQRTVLPSAEQVELMVPQRAPYCAFVTAKHSGAPPIVQWDRPERRNPVTWYLYAGGSEAEAWNLRRLTWAKVTGITLSPAHWYGNVARHHGNMALLLLEGARDVGYQRGGGLFPEHLRAEYHGVRSTIEAHVASSRIDGKESASACGLALQAGSRWDAVVRVLSGGVWTKYKLDRWD